MVFSWGGTTTVPPYTGGISMDNIDLAILSAINSEMGLNHPVPSIEELARATRMSVGTVHFRLRAMVKVGLVEAPARVRQPRSYVITETGKELLGTKQYNPSTINRHFSGGTRWPPR